MKTRLHTYFYKDITKEPEKSFYEELCEKLNGIGLKKFKVFNPSSSSEIPDSNESFEIYLDISFLSNNQWNTSENSPNFPNLRVFDWFESSNIYRESTMRIGHWIEQTQEMIDIRRNTFKCAFCGSVLK